MQTFIESVVLHFTFYASGRMSGITWCVLKCNCIQIFPVLQHWNALKHTNAGSLTRHWTPRHSKHDSPKLCTCTVETFPLFYLFLIFPPKKKLKYFRIVVVHHLQHNMNNVRPHTSNTIRHTCRNTPLLLCLFSDIQSIPHFSFIRLVCIKNPPPRIKNLKNVFFR